MAVDCFGVVIIMKARDNGRSKYNILGADSKRKGRKA